MYYFASDIHLGAGGPAAARAVEKRFVAWLDEVSRDADAVFILGDLFDFWFEYAREYAGAERPDYFIFGHMHQPRDYSEGNLRVLCLGEWHSDPVYAVIDSEGNASLKKY